MSTNNDNKDKEQSEVPNDIYNNKQRYERFLTRYNELVLPPEKRSYKRGSSKYICKNSKNLIYFAKLIKKLEARNVSYIRRLKLLNTLVVIVDRTTKNLKVCEREDIDEIVSFINKIYNSEKSKRDFKRDLKFIWRLMLPDKDEKGRYDELMVPYVVRHISIKTDKSRQKVRRDIFEKDELIRIIDYFSGDVRIQAFIMLSFESLARPQELLYTRIRDYEWFENYARIKISEHGKEGIGTLQSIKSFPYILINFHS